MFNSLLKRRKRAVGSRNQRAVGSCHKRAVGSCAVAATTGGSPALASVVGVVVGVVLAGVAGVITTCLIALAWQCGQYAFVMVAIFAYVNFKSQRSAFGIHIRTWCIPSLIGRRHGGATAGFSRTFSSGKLCSSTDTDWPLAV